jgi:hypothetical protein
MCIAGVENFMKESAAAPEKFTKNSIRLILDAYERDGKPLSVNGAACNLWFLTLAGNLQAWIS